MTRHYKKRKPTLRKTTEQFVAEANLIHSNKYDYSESVYSGVFCKTTIICPKHGKFSQSPQMHLRGVPCPQCSGEHYHTTRTMTTEQFVAKAIKKYGNKFDYSKVNYINSQTPVIIVCKLHGEYKQNPSHYLSKKCMGGCPECFKILVSKRNRSPNQELVKLKAIIRHTCKDLLRNTLGRLGLKKTDSTSLLLSYSRNDLQIYLTSHPNWNVVKNKKWHLDHIFPVSAFVEYGILDLKIINSLDNLQPLTAKENLSKSNKYNRYDFENWLKTKNIVFKSLISHHQH